MVTLRQALETYIGIKDLKERTSRDYRAFLNRCVPDWLDLPIDKINRQMCLERHRELANLSSSYASSSGKGQANIVFRVLRAVFNFSILYWELDIQNPIAAFSTMGAWAKVDDRTSYLEHEQLSDWYRQVLSLPAIDRHYYLTLLLTGQRAAEIAGLLWSEIDFEKGLITLPAERTKNRKMHKFPMSTGLRALLLERRTITGQSHFVFASPGIDQPYPLAKRVYERLEEALGFDCNPHSLRRTFATLARHQCGIDFPTVKRCLNHSSADITDRYIQKEPEALRPAFEAVSVYFFSKVTKEKPRVRLTLEQVRPA